MRVPSRKSVRPRRCSPIVTNHSLLMLADLMGGVAEIRAGSMGNATARLAAQKARYTSAVPLESNWISALEGEIALAQGRYNEAVTSFGRLNRRCG